MSIDIPYNEEEEDDDDEEDGRHICLHGIGFEVYGSVHEEETAQDRIQRLEVENEALLNQNEKQQAQIVALSTENDSLKARVRQLENKRSAEEACLS